jgi:hypothetical protein
MKSDGLGVRNLV